MNIDNRNYGCISCDSGCNDKCKPCGGCGPAAYNCDFSIAAVPFDPTIWNVTWCGKLHRVKIPPIAETDTKLSTNYSNATLNYNSEKHTDIITGAQLGALINVGDLRDTKTDYDTDSLCYELIYHKYGECGEGCKSIENAWSTFSIDNEGALGSQIRYVRGANRYGCPYFLDIPNNSTEFWFQGWRGDTNENGYYQATPDDLPTNANGDYYVMSQYPSNKQPVIGILPWQCMMDNIFGNLGLAVDSVWRPLQGTSGFSASFDQINGAFSINWNDWNDLAETQLAGSGKITGKFNWTASFDTKTGNMVYNISNIYYDTMTWTVVQGVTQPTSPRMRLDGINPITGVRTSLIPAPGVVFGKNNVTRVINQTIAVNSTITVQPGQTLNPMDFAYIYVDWVNDDEGYLGVRFASKLSGWKQC